MVNRGQGYSDGRQVFIPLYQDGTTEAKVKIGTPRTETINNNSLEVSILPHQELSSFIRRLILIFLVVDTVLMLSMVVFLYVRILGLEAESSRLTLLTLQSETKLIEMAEEISALRENQDGYWSVDCSIDFNNTDADVEDFVLDMSEDEEEEEGETDYVNTDRRKRENRPERIGKQGKKNRRKQEKKKKQGQGRRVICHSCDMVPQRRLKQNRLRKVNGSSAGFPMASDVSAIHLKGKLPEVVFDEGVLSGAIGPWMHDGSAATNYFRDFKLHSEGSSVLVLADGYFFIYAQVYYLSSGGSNSYSIVRKRDKSGLVSTDVLATCSNGQGSLVNQSAGHEESCFTATVMSLRKGDRVQLIEREMNRRVLFREGQTYFGLMRLSPSSVGIPSPDPPRPPSVFSVTSAPSRSA